MTRNIGMRMLLATALLGSLLTACSSSSAPTPAKPIDPTAAVNNATVGDAHLRSQTIMLSALNASTAKHYGIDTSKEGVLLLVTVRDAQGNALDPADLQLAASAGVLPDAPTALPLRAVQTQGLTDYIGVVHAKPPASVQFKLTAKRGAASTEVATTVDLQPPR